ncbi:hypothetical protein T310_6000 [Rasamsonia emersonii CBS 393.64]|uniref:DUF1740-domain-containing protein n=1 Tax=Rasamsonia emersonii (strain ATCC 16479 / CBS 393.64 / IMI 116815) TaxID=1408163 RepID=A0A0F4YP11_RASE3|nr:hypothetical protein T310_6000 [Rasamsonia emersonii CBS 393.64]KKA20002.1 hypothetical protein T310_6000 [Rasamsonia emersonii CBS 393.64]
MTALGTETDIGVIVTDRVPESAVETAIPTMRPGLGPRKRGPRYNVPQYHRVGKGRVLGLPAGFKIDRDHKDEATIVIRTDTDIWQGDGSRHKSKSVLSRGETKETRFFRVRRETASDASDARKDFLPLSSEGSRKRRKLLGDFSAMDTSDSEAEKYAYRSIHGKAKPEQDIGSDLEIESASDLSENDGVVLNWEQEVRQRNSELSRRVEEHPEDIDAWLELIKHQDALLSGSREETRQLTAAEKRSLADIKLSLYEKAIKKVGANPAKDRLLLGYLEEGAKLWDFKKLSEQWHDVLKRNSRAIFVDCMKLNASSPDSPEKAVIHAYLFLRMTLFMREAGFLELANGLWQAVLEFTFFRPEEFKRDSGERALTAFMDFWDSEVARIGEEGAKGWNSDDNASLEPRISASQSRVVPGSLFASWLESETVQRRNARLPARTLDEGEDDDPYRVVLSSDIQDFLPYFTDWKSPDVLIESFLCFCRLPPLASPTLSETSRSWSGDPFLRNELVESPDSALVEMLSTRQSEPHHSPKVLDSPPLQNVIHSLDTLFAEKDRWFSSLATWKTLVFSDYSPIDPDWVRRALRLLVDASPADDALAEYVLAVEFVCDAKEAKKYAKSLLKRRSASLRLYNVYALMECQSGNSASAAHVWATTLSMSTSISDVQKLEYGPLWRTWVWESLDGRKQGEAVQLLLAIPGYTVDLKSLGDAPTSRIASPAELLKSQRFLSESQEHSLAVQNYRAFVAWTDCLALLLYLTRSSDLGAAVDVYKSASERLAHVPQISKASVSYVDELLHQSRARLLYHHVVASHAYKPAQIRTLLHESISHFPHNTMFLSLYAWNESRFRIDERVRDVLRDITQDVRKHDTGQSVPVTSHLFAIFHEIHRPVYSGSTLHSARAAFERAIGDPAFWTGGRSGLADNTNTGQSSLSLWKLYVLFELRHRDMRRAKDVFYRGMRACPWSKDLLLLAFRHLRGEDGGMGFDELRRVYNVLEDKELRIHVEIDEATFGKAEAIFVRERMMRDGNNPNTMISKSTRFGPDHQQSRARDLPIHLPEDADSGSEDQKQ